MKEVRKVPATVRSTKKRREREPWETVLGLIFIFLGLNLMTISIITIAPGIVCLMAVGCFVLAGYLLPSPEDEGNDKKDE